LQPYAVSASGECHRAAAIALPVLAALKVRSFTRCLETGVCAANPLVNSYSSRRSAELSRRFANEHERDRMERALTRLADSIR
jgi:hypothetical protein